MRLLTRSAGTTLLLGLTFSQAYSQEPPIAAHATVEECSAYIGGEVVPTPFDSVIARYRRFKPKGEFETTPDYAKREAAFVAAGRNEYVVKTPVEDRKFITYDADRGVLGVEQWAFHNTNWDFWSAFYTAKLDDALDVPSVGHIGLAVSSKDIVAGTYVGSNAYGAKATITRINRTTRAIFDRKAGWGRGESTLFPSQGLEPLGEIQMTPAEAQVIKPELELALTVRPKAPFIAEGVHSTGKATISNPFDVTERFTILIADIRCGLVLAPEGRVLAAYATN